MKNKWKERKRENRGRVKQISLKKWKFKPSKTKMSIRFQLMIGFMIPVLCVIAVGVTSYQKAAAGLKKNYEASSQTALQMTMTSFEEAMQSIATATAELSQDATVMSYSLGGFDSDSVKQAQAVSNIRNILNVKETSSDMIEAIHIIPVAGDDIITTKTLKASSMDSFIGEFSGTEDEALLADGYLHWGTTHAAIDEQMGMEQTDYMIYCSKCISSGPAKALVVIDISTQAMQELLEKLDFGKGSAVSFITGQGEELDCGATAEIAETDFFKDGVASGEETVSRYVDKDGVDYYFMLQKSDLTGGYMTVMVPKSVITQSSESIRAITAVMVVAACIIAMLIGTFIIANITHHISRSVKKLDKVSEGELLEEKETRAVKNEFGKLHGAIKNTVNRIRELVLAVKRMIELVSVSGESVNESSREVGDRVLCMGEQVQQIKDIMAKEDEEIPSCNEQMRE